VVAGKLKTEDILKLNGAVDSALSWLDTHQSASKEEFEAKQKELEGTAMPIMSKLEQESGGAGGAGGSTRTLNKAQGPLIEGIICNKVVD